MPEAVPNQKGRVLVYKLGGTVELPVDPEIDRNFPTPPIITAPPVMLERGRELYQYYCWQCHGANVISSGVLPDLRRSGMLHSKEAWANVVVDDALEDKGMGSFGDWLSQEDAEALRFFVAAEAARIFATTATTRQEN